MIISPHLETKFRVFFKIRWVFLLLVQALWYLIDITYLITVWNKKDYFERKREEGGEKISENFAKQK